MTTSIKAKTFYIADAAVAVDYAIDPIDQNGFVAPTMVVECALSNDITITLPEISTLKNNFNFELTVVAKTVAVGKKVTVNAGGTDLIGSVVAMVADTVGQSLIFTPADNGIWSVLKSA